MKNYRRICILGNSGSGKSTLATRLAKVTGLPLIHLDKLFWRPGWTESSEDEFRQAADNAAAGKCWIIDGNYKKTLAERLERADLVVLFDYKPIFCLWRVIWRILTTTVRPDMAEGCKERFDINFCKYVLNYNRKVKPKLLEMIRSSRGHFDFICLRHVRDVDIMTAAIATNFDKKQ